MFVAEIVLEAEWFCCILPNEAMKSIYKPIGVVLFALLLLSCATPDARIKKHQELYDSLDPQTQERVREGRVALGDHPDVVFIARGKPDREYTRRTADGLREVWAYTGHYTQTRRQLVDGNFRVRDSRTGQIHTVRDQVWVEVPTYHEYDQFRVEFLNDRVVAVEELAR